MIRLNINEFSSIYHPRAVGGRIECEQIKLSINEFSFRTYYPKAVGGRK